MPDKIDTDTIWRSEDGPFVILSDLYIEKDARLSVESGTIVAISGDISVLVYGELALGKAELAFGKIDAPEVIVDSTINLAGRFPELEEWTFDGGLDIYVYGGSADMTNVEVKIPLRLQSDDGDISVRGGRLAMSEMVFLNGAHGILERLSVEESDGIMLQSTSTLSVRNSSIDGSGRSGSLFNVFKNSSVTFENTSITPNLSDFALILDGSSLAASSTSISGMGSYGVEASRGSSVSLYDVSMDTIFSPISSSAFVVLAGSGGHIDKSDFSNTSSNAIELYRAGDRSSSLLLRDSRISDFGGAGISAVQADLSVIDSVIENGGIGVENIFATSTVSNSKISDNTKYGIAAHVASFPVYAENNFWGDPSGPYHGVSNTTGLGNAVSDNVVFSPWLAVDPKTACCSSVMFLPGMESSRLYQDETRLWEPPLRGTTTARLALDGSGKSLYKNIYAREVIKEAFLPLGPDIYRSFFAMMDDLKWRKVIADWLAVPYDWRLSFDELLENGSKTPFGISYLEATSSPFIIAEFKRLAAGSKTGKVTIIAHSNGGLLAKALMDKLSSSGSGHLVDRLVLVAVPHIGTPQAIGALLHGYDQSIPFFLSAEEAVMLSLNMPSAYNLLPSGRYFDMVFDPVIKFRESKAVITSADSFHRFLGQKKLNSLLLEKSKSVHEFYDGWLPPSGLEVIQIAGWGIDTLYGLEYFQGVRRGKPVERYKPMMVIDGDSTVIVPSALYLSTSTPDVERYWLDLGSHNRASLLSRKHGNIFEVKGLRDFIRQIVEKKRQPLPIYISTTTPRVKKGAKRLHFTLYSPEFDLHLYDETGGHTGISTTTLSLEERIADTYYQKFGRVKYLSTYATTAPMRLVVNKDHFEIEATPGDSSPDQERFPSSFTLEVDEVIGNSIATTSVFVDLPVVENSVAVLDVPESVSDLKPILVDKDGDGVFDFEAKPGEVFSYGVEVTAPTVEPPTVELSAGREITSNKMDQLMETANLKTVTPASVNQPGKRTGVNFSVDSLELKTAPRTSLREIQELIDSIELPDQARENSVITRIGRDERDIKIGQDASNSQMDNQSATVFQSNRPKSALYSLFLIIVAILKAIFRWFINLLNL